MPLVFALGHLLDAPWVGFSCMLRDSSSYSSCGILAYELSLEYPGYWDVPGQPVNLSVFPTKLVDGKSGSLRRFVEQGALLFCGELFHSSIPIVE